MKKLFTALAFLFLLVHPAHAQYVRLSCATLSPAAGFRGTCFDYTTFALNYWSGSAWIPITGGGGGGTVTQVNTGTGLTGGPITTTGTVSGVDAAADGSTKGIAAFSANDFNSTSGVISLDYANGQKANGSQAGFLSSSDWTTFNSKQPAGSYLTAETDPVVGAVNGIVKANGAGTISAAAAGTDYAAAPSGSANTPLFNNGSGGFTNGTRSGSTTKVVTMDASTPATDDCAKWDANHNLTTAGAACGSGGGSGTVTSIATSNGITGGTITTTGTISGVDAAADGATKGVAAFTANDFDAASGVVSLDYTNGQKASASVPGFLSSTDWSTFNNKQPAGTYLTAVTANAPLSGSGTSGSHLVISQSGAATDGYLSSTDWNTFNNKVGGPAGADGDIQFNNGGSFGGDSKVTRYTLGGNKTFLSTNDTVESGLDMTVNNVSAFIMSAKNIYSGTNKDLAIANDPLGTYGLLINGDTNQVEIPNHLLVDQTITTMTGLPADFKILYSHPVVTATDGAPGDAVASLTSRMDIGPSGEAVQGNFHAVVSDVRINGSGNDASEYTSWLGLVDVRIGTGYTQSTGPAGRAWGSDWTVQGPIAVQPNLLNGFTQFVGNYYNGSPSASSSGGIWITTAPNGGAAGTEGVRNGATTYPLDVGLGITGASGTVGTPSGLGFTTGIQIGGNGSGWWESGQTRIGTGINIRDFTTRGIYVNNPIGTPTADIETTGKVIVGGNLTNSVLTASELVGTDASKNLASVSVGTGLSLSGGTLSATGGSGTVVFQNPGLRLTLTTGVPVTTSDVTGAGTLYYTPFTGCNLVVIISSALANACSPEISISLTITSGKNYDAFVSCTNSTTCALALSSAWTNDTTRADALATETLCGCQVLSSDHTKLWIGTIRASATNVTEDSDANRFVGNVYNAQRRRLLISAVSSHTGSSTWVEWNSGTADRASFIVPIPGRAVSQNSAFRAGISTGHTLNAVGRGFLDAVGATYDVDNSFAQANAESTAGDTVTLKLLSNNIYYPSIGYHFIGVGEQDFSSVGATFAYLYNLGWIDN